MLSLFRRNKKVVQGSVASPAYIEYSPRHYLQASLRLLDIYRGVGKRHEYEILAGQLHQSFNVWIDPWQDAVVDAATASLKHFPHILKHLEECWGRPECLTYLEHLLEDNRGGSRHGFPRPVLHEIVTLLAMHDDATPVAASSRQAETESVRVRQPQLAAA